MIDLKAVAEELTSIEITDDKTIKNLYEEFYAVMRKHGIKQGTKNESGGITMCNAEWSVCHTHFEKKIQLHFILHHMLNCPKDLIC